MHKCSTFVEFKEEYNLLLPAVLMITTGSSSLNINYFTPNSPNTDSFKKSCCNFYFKPAKQKCVNIGTDYLFTFAFMVYKVNDVLFIESKKLVEVFYVPFRWTFTAGKSFLPEGRKNYEGR